MRKVKVILNTIDNIKEFVMNMNKYDLIADVSTDNRKQLVDAKSIMGVIAISSNKPITVTLLDNDKDKVEIFDTIMQKFNIVE